MSTVSYGGQAVLEGVMIRGAGSMAVACRRPGGGIAVRTQAVDGISTSGGRRLPLLRGVLALYETLYLGMRALTFSSNVAREPADASAPEPELPETVYWGSIAAAVGFIMALFFATPLVVAHGAGALGAHRLIVVAVEAVVRLGMFFGYIVLIGFIPGIRRVFQYHGAEHMAVHANEAGAPLAIDSVRAFPKEHTRCGTSFLLVVMVVSLAAFFVFDLAAGGGFLTRIVSRFALVPVIAGISYELLRLGAKYSHHGVVRALFLPNIALQALTTRVPDDSQIEVAVTSLEAVIACSAVLVETAAADLETDLAVAPAGN
jgi:uncharacterized protein YqhQ